MASPPSHDTAELFRAMFDASGDAIVVVDPEGRIALANAACQPLLGHAPGALIGRVVEDLVPARFAGHRARREGFVARPLARGMGQGLPLHARHADGREIPVDIALTPLAVNGGRWTACTLRDLRGRAHASEALRLQTTALRSAANGVVITDRTGTITWVNPATCTITGYAEDELIGQHTRLLKSGEHDPAFYARLWQTIVRGETFSGTMVNRRKDGSLYTEEQTIAPVLDERGEITHFIAIKQDVSARRRAEEALAAANAELAARVAEIETLNRRLHEQATRDPLTGLYNRRYLDDAIAREVARVARTGEPLVVAMLDVDHFKRVNDAHGHPSGDRVLRALADVLRDHVRGSDLLCRVGGEEFVVVMPGAPLAVGEQRADQWRRTFGETTVDAVGGAPLRCTVSIGVALHVPGDDVASTIARADAALYTAKRAGRDRVVAAD